MRANDGLRATRTKANPDQHVVGFSIDLPLFNRLQAVAEFEGRSTAAQMRVILREWLNEWHEANP